MKESIVERLLYICLALVFVGVCIAVYVAASFGHKLSQTQKANQAILNEIKAQSDRQSAELLCVAELFTTHEAGAVTLTDFNSCATQPNQSISSSQTSTPAPISTQPSSKSTQTSSNSAPSSNPSPKPNAVQQVLKMLGL